MDRKIRLEAMMDSRTVFIFIAKDGQRAERRLQINVLALRKSDENGKLDRIEWIQG